MDSEDIAKRAREHFESGYNCAQATTLAVNEAFGLDVEGIPRIMQPFGGGVARTDNMCGAVTGAVLGIGMLFGRDGEGAEEAKVRCYDLTRRYIEEFTKRRGSVRCTDLIEHDLSDPDQRAGASDKGVFQTICPGIVEDSMKAFMDVIEDEL